MTIRGVFTCTSLEREGSPVVFLRWGSQAPDAKLKSSRPRSQMLRECHSQSTHTVHTSPTGTKKYKINNNNNKKNIKYHHPPSTLIKKLFLKKQVCRPDLRSIAQVDLHKAFFGLQFFIYLIYIFLLISILTTTQKHLFLLTNIVNHHLSSRAALHNSLCHYMPFHADLQVCHRGRKAALTRWSQGPEILSTTHTVHDYCAILSKRSKWDKSHQFMNPNGNAITPEGTIKKWFKLTFDPEIAISNSVLMATQATSWSCPQSTCTGRGDRPLEKPPYM